MSTIYQAEFCLAGAIKCDIAERVVFKTYEAYFRKNAVIADAYAETEKWSKKVADALGKNYVLHPIENGTLFTESSRADVNGSWILEVKKEKGKGKTVNILLRIEEQPNH